MNKKSMISKYPKLVPGVKLTLMEDIKEGFPEEEVELIEIERNGMLIVQEWGWEMKPGSPPNEMFEVSLNQVKKIL